MQDTLNSIYLRLDVNMQYLASKALAQIIVKLVYAKGDVAMTARSIKEELTKLNEGKYFDDTEVDTILADLENKELRCRKGYYYLSTSRKEKIRESLEESNQRLESILNKYFCGLNSSREILRNWLSVITRTFFESYSNEWISDLKARTNHISHSAESIKLQVTRRTNAMKDLDSDDKKVLPKRFFDLLNSHDTDVEDFLWGYGTSSFASKLITNKYGIDKLTMEAFKDSLCILDTNVLLFIALESKYADSFKAIEKVFIDLNIQPYYLYVTKREFENKVHIQRDITLSNFDKYGYDTISRSEDDFTVAATRQKCREKEDFERFFNFTLSLPSKIYKDKSIKLLDDDARLIEAIENAQANEQLIDELNTLYKQVVGHDKSPSACRHDIGLLEGVRHLRSREGTDTCKCFIISDEISVNQYSKLKGIKHNLPLSLRVDTLINMLAVNNGGDTFNASDYKSLFANIIRLELIPRKDTFNQEELYQLAQMNARISALPSDEVYDIAMQIHRRRVSGESEADIRRELNILVTRGELQVKDELSDMKGQLAVENKEKERLSHELQAAHAAVRRKVEEYYDKQTKATVRKWIIGIILASLFLAAVIVGVLRYNTSSVDLLLSFVIGIVGSAVVSIFGSLFAKGCIIRERNQNRQMHIDEEVQQQLSHRY